MTFNDRFQSALDAWHAGQVDEAVCLLGDLQVEAEGRKFAAVQSVSAAVLYEAGLYHQALPHARAVVEASPGSELASLTLFFILAHLGLDGEALDEMARYVKHNGFSQRYQDVLDELRAAWR